MKLKKRDLIKAVSSPIIEMGFTEFKDTIFNRSGFFVKRIRNDLFLSLGLNISQLYDSLFTCDMYLSRTTRIGSVWGDVPRQCYTRPGYLLTQSEIEPYQDGNPLMRDIWWSDNDEHAYSDFIRVLKIAVKRFLEDELLIQHIYESKVLEDLYNEAQLVKKEVSNIQSYSDYNFNYIPNKEIDHIPMNWFCAAEIVLNKKRVKIHNRWVKVLAGDAYRQFILNIGAPKHVLEYEQKTNSTIDCLSWCYSYERGKYSLFIRQ